MFDRLKPKISSWCSITIRQTSSNPFNIYDYDVRVCLISNSVNLEKALLGSMFDVRLFDEHIQVRSMLYKMVFDSSLQMCIDCFLLHLL